MAKPSDYPGFRALLSEWNKKLSDSGFNDAEVMRNGQLELKESGSARRYKSMDATRRNAREEYFQIVSRRVAETRFKDETEQKILTLHAQGFSQLDIQRILQIPGHRCHVYAPLYRWLERWGLR